MKKTGSPMATRGKSYFEVIVMCPSAYRYCCSRLLFGQLIALYDQHIPK